MLNEGNRLRDKRAAIHRSLLKRLSILLLLILAFAALAQTLTPQRGGDEASATDQTDPQGQADAESDSALSDDELLLTDAAGDDELEVLEDDPLSDETAEEVLTGEGELPDDTDPLAELDDELLAEGELDPSLEMDASMEKFVPTEKISEDRSVSFPNDI